MANSPHRPDDNTPTMPSLTPGQPPPSQNNRLLYRSTGRGESCEHTINNTLDNFIQANKKENPNEVANYQNFQAMQMAIHNGSGGHGRMRMSQMAKAQIRNSEKNIKERISLPVIGRVNATQESRTGILTKTQSMKNEDERMRSTRAS